jgi:hypothetical protein
MRVQRYPFQIIINIKVTRGPIHERRVAKIDLPLKFMADMQRYILCNNERNSYLDIMRFRIFFFANAINYNKSFLYYGLLIVK